MASMRFDRLASVACLLAAFVIASPVVAAPPGGAPPFHEWLFGRGRIGIRVQPLTPELREHFGAPSDRGVLVSEVEETVDDEAGQSADHDAETTGDAPDPGQRQSDEELAANVHTVEDAKRHDA